MESCTHVPLDHSQHMRVDVTRVNSYKSARYADLHSSYASMRQDIDMYFRGFFFSERAHALTLLPALSLASLPPPLFVHRVVTMSEVEERRGEAILEKWRAMMPSPMATVVRLVSAESTALPIPYELALMSPVMKAALQSDMLESQQNLVHLPEISEKALLETIEYLKTDFNDKDESNKVFEPDPVSCIETMMAGSYLQLPNLVKTCSACVSNHFNSIPAMALEFVPDDIVIGIIEQLKTWELRYAESVVLGKERCAQFHKCIVQRWKSLFSQEWSAQLVMHKPPQSFLDSWTLQREWCLRQYLERMTQKVNQKRLNTPNINIEEYKRRLGLIGPLLSSVKIKCDCFTIDDDTLEYLLYSLRNAMIITLKENRLGSEAGFRIARAIRPCGIKCDCPAAFQEPQNPTLSNVRAKCGWKGAYVCGLDIGRTGITTDSVYALCRLVLNQSNTTTVSSMRGAPQHEIHTKSNATEKAMSVVTLETIQSTQQGISSPQQFVRASPRIHSVKNHRLHAKLDLLRRSTAVTAVGKASFAPMLVLKSKTVSHAPMRPTCSRQASSNRASATNQAVGVRSFRTYKANTKESVCRGNRAPLSPPVAPKDHGHGCRWAKGEPPVTVSVSFRPTKKGPSSLLRGSVRDKLKRLPTKRKKSRSVQRKPLFLSISNNPIGDAGMIAIAESILATGGCLQSLCLRGNVLTDDAASALGNMLRSAGTASPLTNLDLSSCKLGRFGLAAIAQALMTSSLMSLNLGNNLSMHSIKPMIGVTDKIGTSLGRLLSTSAYLTDLNIEGNAFVPKEMEEIVTGMASNYSLTKLNISNTEATGKMSRLLAYSLMINKKNALRHLNLSNNSIGDARFIDDYASLCSHQHISLTVLNLSGNVIDDISATKFGKAMKSKFCRLQVLRLDSTHRSRSSNAATITCNGFSELIRGAAASIPGVQRTRLTFLSVRFHEVRSTGATLLAGLLRTTKLKVVDLSHNKISESGAVGIAYALVDKNGDNGDNRLGNDKDEMQSPRTKVLMDGNPMGDTARAVLKEMKLLW